MKNDRRLYVSSALHLFTYSYGHGHLQQAVVVDKHTDGQFIVVAALTGITSSQETQMWNKSWFQCSVYDYSLMLNFTVFHDLIAILGHLSGVSMFSCVCRFEFFWFPYHSRHISQMYCKTSYIPCSIVFYFPRYKGDCSNFHYSIILFYLNYLDKCYRYFSTTVLYLILFAM